MPGAPDELIFSDSPEHGAAQITWGALRANHDAQFRLLCLSKRIRGFLLDQTSRLLNEGTNAPFPLVVTTTVGIGSLAEVFYSDTVPARQDERNRIIFCCFADKIAEDFSRSLKKDFKVQFAERWGERPRTGSQILYTFFRNSLVHGYYGQAVFLTGDETDSIEYRADGCVLLNPEWFFTRFAAAANTHLDRALEEQENGCLRRNALGYVAGLLGEIV